MSEEIGLLKNIKWINRNVLLVERADGQVLLIRRHFPCSHRTANGDYSQHIHYYVTSKDRISDINKLNKLLDWLENGFWHDSMIWDSEEGLKNIIMKFLKHKCLGAIQPF